jgi:tripartite-type tricarboxylate transporter receptor subunit TctC
MQRRLFAGALGASVLAAPVVRAQVFDRPLRLIVPFAPGGTSDILARILGPSVGRQIGQNVVVENRAGAAGNVGADFVAKSAPDGSTILLIDTGALATAPSLYQRLSFDPTNDLAPVNLLIYAPYLLAVHPSVPANTPQELAALAKARPQALNIANSGVGGATHLTSLVLAQHWGAELTQVPYRGGAAALTAVSAGESQMLVNGATATAPFVRDGRLKGIAVTGPRRFADFPNLPTFAELGWPGAEAGTFQGVLVRAGTPAVLVNKLDEAFRNAMAEPDNARRLADIGAETQSLGPDAFRSWMVRETEQWGRVVRANNIRLD